MSAENQRLVGSAVEKLKFIDSPLHKEPKPARTESSLHSSTFTVVERRDTTQRRLEEIRLAHNDDATNLEIFYDLFLAVSCTQSNKKSLHQSINTNLLCF
jgi:hypothetical protein